MNDVLQRLKQAEAALVSEGTRCASASDYTKAAQIFGFAEELKLFQSKVADLLPEKDSATMAPEDSKNGDELGDEEQPDEDVQAEDEPTSETPKGQRRLSRKDYPKFKRNGDELIKIGWSKRAKEEYEHKSPKIALTTLTTAVLKVAQKRRLFAMEDVLPLKSSDGTEIPDYQPYLCLAWLRHEGLIVQHGRKGYSVPKPSEFENKVNRLWDTISED